MEPTSKFKITQPLQEQPEASKPKPVVSSSESLAPLFQQHILDPSQAETPKPLADHVAHVKNKTDSQTQSIALGILQISPRLHSPSLSSEIRSPFSQSSSSSSSAEPLSVAVPGSVQPAIAVAVPRPARSNSIIEDKKNEWIAAHTDPKMQEAVKALTEGIVHISQDQFEESFRQTLEDLSVSMGNKPFSAAVEKGKSNLWMAMIAQDLDKELYRFPTIPLVLDVHLKNMRDTADFPENIVLFDDAIYSGEQITRFIKGMVAAIDVHNSKREQQNRVAHPHFTVACPYITSRGKANLESLSSERVSVSILAHKKILTVAESVPEPHLATLEGVYWPTEVAARFKEPSPPALLPGNMNPGSRSRGSNSPSPGLPMGGASDQSERPKSRLVASNSSAADSRFGSSSSASPLQGSVEANSSVPSRAKRAARRMGPIAKILADKAQEESNMPFGKSDKHVAKRDGAYSRGLTYFDHKVPDQFSFPGPLALGQVYLASGRPSSTNIRFIDETDPPYSDLAVRKNAAE